MNSPAIGGKYVLMQVLSLLLHTWRALNSLNVMLRRAGNVKNYVDTGDTSSIHELSNNPGENTVHYVECSGGSAELGFRTYYGLVDVVDAIVGDIGTIKDRTGIAPPHGHNVFTLATTGSFVYVALDTVDLSLYQSVTAYGWLRDTSTPSA